MRRLIVSTAGVAGLMLCGAAFAQSENASAAAVNLPFVYSVIGVVFAAALIAMWMIRQSIGKSKTFSLADALSEEATVSTTTGGVTTSETKLVGSTSRVIALMGSVVIMLLFVGFGAFVLYYYGTNQGVPSGTKDVISFLVAGLTLFAPYTVNQFSSIFGKLA